MFFQLKLHNVSKFDKDDFNNLILRLQKNFSDWQFKDMDGLNEIPNSIHFHVSSHEKGVSGTLEITFDPALDKVVLLKVSKNRASEWSLKALDEAIKFIEQG